MITSDFASKSKKEAITAEFFSLIAGVITGEARVIFMDLAKDPGFVLVVGLSAICIVLVFGLVVFPGKTLPDLWLAPGRLYVP